MTDKFTIEQIEAAITSKVNLFWADDAEIKTLEKIAENTIAKLTKSKWEGEPEQVVHASYLEDDQPTGAYLQGKDIDSFECCRPLNQTEVGPDWGRDELILKARITELEALTNRQIERTGKLTGQVDTLLKQNRILDDVLDEAVTGIEWYIDMFPEVASGADDEFLERAKQARQAAQELSE